MAILAGIERHSAACAVGIWILLFGVYLASPVRQVTDSEYTLLASEHLLRSGNLRLDEHFWPAVDSSGYPHVKEGGRLPRQIRESRTHLHHKYPPGTPVLSAPFVALLKLVTGQSILRVDGTYDMQTERRWQGWCAAFVTASACVLLFLLARELLAVVPSAVIALAAGLSTQLWSTASRCLWTHTWEVFLLSASLLLLVRAETRGRGRPVALATLLSWAFFTRPTAGLLILVIALLVLHRRPREFRRLALVGGAWALLFAAYCQIEYASWLPNYYFRAEGLRVARIPLGLAGQLISPSRGLLVFVPLVPFVLWLVARHWKWIQYQSLALAALAALAMHTMAMASFRNWWGGHSYGPRFHTDMVPILVLLGVLGLRAASRRRGEGTRAPLGRVASAAFVTCLAMGAVLNGAGAISVNGWNWNMYPKPIAADPMRAFDWKTSQFLYALFPDRFAHEARK